MHNFSRVLRLAMRYRLTLVGAMASALVVAVLWGANIGAVFPFVQVVFEGESLQQWVDREIVKAQKGADEQTARIEGFQRQLAEAAPERERFLLAQISLAESRRTAEEWGQQEIVARIRRL